LKRNSSWFTFVFERYDPYSKEFTREYYDTKTMHTIRQQEIAKAAKGQVWGLVLGSLGRQGSPKVLQVNYFLFYIFLENCFHLDNKTTFDIEWQKIYSSYYAGINAR